MKHSGKFKYFNHKIDYAISLGLHRLEPSESGEILRQILDRQEKLDFFSLRAGITVLAKSGYSYENSIIYVIHRITPSGNQAEVSVFGEDEKFKIYSGNNDTLTFIVLSEEFLFLFGFHHKDFVIEALNRGLSVPPKVKIYHPDLFVEIPERFSVEEVSTSLMPNWGKFLTVEDLEDWIHSCQRDKSLLEQRKALEGGKKDSKYFSNDFDFLINEQLHKIALYEWLKDHVKEGGVFFIEQ